MGKEGHNFLPQIGDQEGPQKGPSWSNPSWMETILNSNEDLITALDPAGLKEFITQASLSAGKSTDPQFIENAARDSIKAMMLIRLYRVRDIWLQTSTL